MTLDREELDYTLAVKAIISKNYKREGGVERMKRKEVRKKQSDEIRGELKKDEKRRKEQRIEAGRNSRR